ncbi:MAG: hypothetical protein II942_00260 [Alphaproteobacteria bacterium]|nr:hypothetical protein [Alphaproteobacteria bacterium]
MKKLLLSAALSTLIATSANAKLFNLDLSQGSLNESRSYDSVLDLFHDYEKGKLDKIISTYDDTKASSGAINFRGIPMTLDFDDSAKLTFKVAALGINEEFDGGTQKESFKMFKKYLEKNKNGLLKKILKAGVEHTPFDAVAGNPNSLMSQMADSSFYRAGGNSVAGGAVSGTTNMSGFVGYLAPGISRHSVKFQGDTAKATTVYLPIGATFKMGDSGWALLWDMPFTYTTMEGSDSYMAQMGLGLKIPVMKYWNITPAARAGVVGSADMLSGGVLYSGTITSDVTVPFGNWTVGMTNMAGIIRDVSLAVGDYEVEYDMQNEVFKNGVHVRYDFNDKYAIGAAYDYTFYTGDKLYIDSYHTVELSATRKMEGFFSGVSLVSSYTFDSDYKAYHLGLRFSF